MPTEDGGVTEEIVAIKQMLVSHDQSYVDDEKSDKFDEFQKEVYIMSHLRHPCLVRVCSLTFYHTNTHTNADILTTTHLAHRRHRRMHAHSHTFTHTPTPTHTHVRTPYLLGI